MWSLPVSCCNYATDEIFPALQIPQRFASTILSFWAVECQDRLYLQSPLLARTQSDWLSAIAPLLRNSRPDRDIRESTLMTRSGPRESVSSDLSFSRFPSLPGIGTRSGPHVTWGHNSVEWTLIWILSRWTRPMLGIGLLA